MTRIAIALGAVVAAVCASAALAQDDATPADPARSWAAMAACAAIADADQRHACTDQVLRDAGLLDPVREREQQRQDFGQSPEARAQAAAAVPALPQAAVRGVEVADPLTELDRISTTVADARIGATRQMLVLTAEGAVWRQVTNETMRRVPEPGTGFEVEATALGGYRCSIEGGPSYRCERMN